MLTTFIVKINQLNISIMQKSLMLKGVIFLLCICLSQTGSAQIPIPDWSSIGYIIVNDNDYVGTGFVMNTKRQVVTCAHVISNNEIVFFASSASSNPAQMTKHKLKLIKSFPEYDLALLESEDDLCTRPLVGANDFNIVSKQSIFYSGYDVGSSSDKVKFITFNGAHVTSYGKTFIGSKEIDFIEFIGVGVPGYSGGPVINGENKVFAIMREAWLKQGIKGGSVQLINRAFSIIPIITDMK